MKLSPLFLLSLCGAGVWPLRGQELPVPEIKARTEYEFQTTGGAAYLVEGSADGQTWVTLAGPLFGDGKPARGMLPPRAEGYSKVRVRPVPAADYGPATTELGGKTLALNDKGRIRQVVLFRPIQGVTRGFLKTDAEHARTFVWQVRRTSQSEASLLLEFFDGTGSTIDLTFSNGQLGAYKMRDHNLEGTVQVVEEGAFGVHHGRIRDHPGQTVLPSTLTGRSLGFEEGGALTRMDFGANGNVTLTQPDGTTHQQRYTYQIKTPVLAELRTDSPGLIPQLYDLDLKMQAAGTFNRLPLNFPGGFPVPGVLPRAGTFNLPTGPVLPNSATGPPKSLEGKTIQIGGDDPVILTFNSDGTGSAIRQDNGSVETEPFTYDYSPTDEDEASLALTYPGAQSDRVEDYDLDFSGNFTGSFRGSIYDGGELARSTAGIFSTEGS